MIPHPPTRLIILFFWATIRLALCTPATLPDLQAVKGYLPPLPKAITPEMTRKMHGFTTMYAAPEIHPSGKGLQAGVLDAYARRLAGFGISRAASGGFLATRPILYNGEHGLPPGSPEGALDYFATLKPLLDEMAKSYQKAAKDDPQTAELENLIRVVLECVAGQQWNATTGRTLWVGNGYAVLHDRPGMQLLGLRHLLASEQQRTQLAENVWWMFDGSLLLAETPWLSTDSLRNTMPTAFAGVAALPDGPHKWQRIMGLRRAMDITMAHGDGLVTPDGAVVHHGGLHDHYAHYSFVPVAQIYTRFAAAGFPGEHALLIHDRFRRAGFAWAFTTLGESMAPNLRQRVKLPWVAEVKPTGPGRVDFAIAAGRYAEVAGGIHPKVDRALAELILGLRPDAAPKEWLEAWKNAGYQAAPPTGNISLPTGGAQIHRRDGWLVCVRGQNRHYRGGEGTGGQYRYGQWGERNTYGGNFCRGSLLIADTGAPYVNLLDSGWAADGFNYSLIPGTTTVLHKEAAMVGSLFGTDAALGGGCDLDGQGMWMFSPSGPLPGTTLRKSCFMVDDRITFVTTGVGPAPAGNVVSTILQSTSDPRDRFFINGKAAAEASVALAGSQAHTLLDHRGRGYFLHPGGDDIEVVRGKHEWTYCEAPFFQPADPAFVFHPLADRHCVIDTRIAVPSSVKVNRGDPAQIEGPAKLAHFRASVRHGETATIRHGPGTQPSQRHAFTLLMRHDAGRLDAFARAMAGATPPLVLLTSEMAHVLKDGQTGYLGTALFRPGELPTQQRLGALTAVSRACSLLEKRTDKRLSISIASTDRDDRSPFVIRLAGRWHAESLPEMTTIDHQGAETIVTVPYRNFVPQLLHLTASSVPR